MQRRRHRPHVARVEGYSHRPARRLMDACARGVALCNDQADCRRLASNGVKAAFHAALESLLAIGGNRLQAVQLARRVS